MREPPSVALSVRVSAREKCTCIMYHVTKKHSRQFLLSYVI